MKPLGRTAAVVLLTALSSLPAVRAADDGIISLPPLLVEERDRPLRWRFIELGGREILSVCDDATTRKFAERQWRLDEMLELVLPQRFCVHLAVPETHVMFNEETGRARSREVVAQMVAKAGGSLTADGTVRGLTRTEQSWSDGRFRLGAARVKFLPNLRLVDMDSVAVFSIVGEAAENAMEFTFTPERIAFLLSCRTPALPAWFITGMNGAYVRMQFRVDDIEVRPAVWLSPEESAALAHDPDRPRTLLPLAELFAPTPPEAGSEMARLWQAQCALFVRWAVTDPSRREALWRWLDRLETEPGSENLFRECFGLGFADARDRLSDYLPTAVDRAVTLDAPKPGPVPRVKLRDATDLEIARVRGEWERLEIFLVRKRYPELTEGYIEQARRTLHRAYDRGERDPRLLAVMGLTECDAGNAAAARGLLEAAARGKVMRPRAYYELARLRLQELQRGDATRRLTATETEEVLGPLRVARLDAPPLAEVYLLMAQVCLRSDEPVSANDLAAFREGARLFPAVPAIVMAAIQFHLANGKPEPVAALLATGLRHARDAGVRERLERVQAQLMQRPPQ